MQYMRDEKYHQRERHIYALLFNNNAVYIGQTVSLSRRQKEHESNAGGWPRSFEFKYLATVNGTKELAEDHERAWRYVAASNGHKIYAKPPGIVVNCRYQQTVSSRQIAKHLQWPVAKKGGWGELIDWVIELLK